MKLTKEVLEQYIDLQKEIKKSKNRIAKLEKQSEIISDVVQNGYKRHAVIQGFDNKRKKKLDKLIQVLEKQQNNALEQKNEIANFITSITDSKVRQIFIHRYIDDMEWYQIAMDLGYNDESAPRKKHDRYLKKL